MKSVDKYAQRVRHSYVVLKLILLLFFIIAARSVKNSSIFETLRIRGINPANYCITDHSHRILTDAHNTLQQYPALRKSLQMLSSFMIDVAFVYVAVLW
jgi:hypothetical protein